MGVCTYPVLLLSAGGRGTKPISDSLRNSDKETPYATITRKHGSGQSFSSSRLVSITSLPSICYPRRQSLFLET